MTDRDAASLLDPEWEQETGYFGQLRLGIFSPPAHTRVMAILKGVKSTPGVWDAKFISLVWFIPTFMSWQTDRCVAAGTNRDEYTRAVNEATDILLEVLGAP